MATFWVLYSDLAMHYLTNSTPLLHIIHNLNKSLGLKARGYLVTLQMLLEDVTCFPGPSKMQFLARNVITERNL